MEYVHHICTTILYMTIDEKNDSKMTSIIIGLSSTVLITVIILIVIAPKIFCRHCHEPKEDQDTDADAHENEDEVVFGEIRFPSEVQNEPNTVPLKPECVKISTKLKNTAGSEGKPDHGDCKQVPRDISRTPDVPPYYDSDDSILKKCDSKQNIIMTINPSYRLKKSFFAEADDLNFTELVRNYEREVSCMPATSSCSSSGNNGIIMKGHSRTMPPKPSQRSIVFKETDKSNLLLTCGKGCASTPTVLPPRHNNHYSDNIIKKCDSQESISMTKNPSYQFEKQFFAEQ